MRYAPANFSRRIGLVLLFVIFAELVRVESGSRCFEPHYSTEGSPAIALVVDHDAEYPVFSPATDALAPLHLSPLPAIPGVFDTFSALLLLHSARAHQLLRHAPHPVLTGAFLPFPRIFSSESSDDGQPHAS